MGGGVEFWIGLPMDELMEYLREIGRQIEQENEALERDRKG